MQAADDGIGSTHPAHPVPRRIEIDPDGGGYTRVLGGPPESVTMRSGQVILAPGQSVGRHSTQGYEELIVVLAGTGQLHIGDAGNAASGRVIELGVNVVTYCPPRTEHDVVNTGAGPLRYLFTVARAADESPSPPAGRAVAKGAPE
jgi:mannose-6-phosphate isomerase-like protein (cupin superfamily)